MIRGKRKAQRLVLPHTLMVRGSVRPYKTENSG